ncbi:MAG: alpha/beta fold hydrolase [Chloroflexota bacterium]
MKALRLAGLTVAAVGAPFALAYRFARVYRDRAGFPKPTPPRFVPTDLGLAFEEMTVETQDGLELPAWFMPARDGRVGPGVVLVHGWESARDRTLPNARFLVAAGFHCLTIDIRGHGHNPPERLPVSTGEFGVDAGAAFAALLARPEVTVGAILGHSMGAVGSLLAAAADPRVAAVVATSTPADPDRLTRQTFRLAHLPIPDPVAYPLAWMTTRVFLKPRRHRARDISATRAIAEYAGPVLLIHGADDRIVPSSHLDRLDAAAREARAGTDTRAVRLVVEGGQHSWLYESPAYRGAIARFLAEALGGPFEPDEAAALAVAVDARRLPDAETTFSAMDGEPGGVRTLARAVTARGRRKTPTSPGAEPTPAVSQRDDVVVGGQAER